MDQLVLIETIQDIKKEFPSFEIVEKKDSLFMRIIYYILLVITFGSQKDFMISYTTTIGNTVYVPSKWTDYSVFSKTSLLKHERTHMQQAKRYTSLLYGFLYLLFPLPIGLAYYRAKFEKEAYKQTIKFAYEIYGDEKVNNPDFKEYIISQFTTGKYLWMWPFKNSMEKWFDETVAACKEKQ